MVERRFPKPDVVGSSPTGRVQTIVNSIINDANNTTSKTVLNTEIDLPIKATSNRFVEVNQSL